VIAVPLVVITLAAIKIYFVWRDKKRREKAQTEADGINKTEEKVYEKLVK